MAPSDDVALEIQFLVDEGFHNREGVFQRVIAATEPATEPAALRELIERAFREKAEAMASWPARTDCDRLRAAFDSLSMRGIVALENAGLTQSDGIPHAADLAFVRDELGGERTRGYCFFTWNDMARAIDGEGLSLAYGTFEEGDPDRLARTIGAAVAKACRKAGLEVEWDGSPDSYVELPRFVWRRRQIASTESDVRDFLEGWELEIRAGYTPAGALADTLEERAFEWFEGFVDFGPELRARLHDATDAFVAEEQRREATWATPTVNDRITAAFEELNGAGVLARECGGLTMQDCWGRVGVDAEPHHRGAVFFHHEDVIDAVAGHGLLLGFGAVGVEPSEEASASRAVGDQVMAALQRNGIPCTWNRTVAQRIRIEPFAWRRRRWTTAPAHERLPSAPPADSTTSIAAAPGARPVARACAIVVRALRDEGGFDLRRSRRLRACWQERGGQGESHAAHLGLPHVFVPAGMYTSMVPRLASDNVVTEKQELVRRGVIATRGESASRPTPPPGA